MLLRADPGSSEVLGRLSADLEVSNNQGVLM